MLCIIYKAMRPNDLICCLCLYQLLYQMLAALIGLATVAASRLLQ